MLGSSGPDIGLEGFLRMTAGRYESNGGTQPNFARTGLSLSNVRLAVDGRVQDVRVYFSFEGSSEQGKGYLFKNGEADELVVLDAFADVGLAPWATVRVGQFRPPILFSSLIDENDLLFIDRTFNSLVYQDREPGAEVLLDGGRLACWLALQNGVDGSSDELAFTGRLALRVFGEGEAPRREGAYDPDLGHTLYVGGSWHEDASLDDGTTLSAEAHYTWEWLALSGEVVDHGEDLLGGHLFWSATGAVALVPEKWELALRYEDFNSRSDTYVYRVGINRYLRGPGTKIQANVVRLEHDGADNYQTLLELGFVASF